MKIEGFLFQRAGTTVGRSSAGRRACQCAGSSRTTPRRATCQKAESNSRAEPITKAVSATLMPMAPKDSHPSDLTDVKWDRGAISVGAEVESWCGKCKEMRAHHIVAMFADLPKQVICVMCKSRHGYRSEPLHRGEAVVEDLQVLTTTYQVTAGPSPPPDLEFELGRAGRDSPGLAGVR